jgi:hypothetical protein
VLLLQPWSTATVQTKNRPIEPTARIFSSITIPRNSPIILPDGLPFCSDMNHARMDFRKAVLLLVGGFLRMVLVHCLVSPAKQYWEPRILGECPICQGTLAHVEDRSSIGFDAAHRPATFAKPDVHGMVPSLLVHLTRISRRLKWRCLALTTIHQNSIAAALKHVSRFVISPIRSAHVRTKCFPFVSNSAESE